MLPWQHPYHLVRKKTLFSLKHFLMHHQSVTNSSSSIADFLFSGAFFLYSIQASLFQSLNVS